MSNVVAKQDTQVTAPTTAWGAEGASTKDVVLPRLYLMQDLSKAVKNRQANVGEIMNGSTNEVVAGPDKKVEIIPILTYAEWLNYDLQDQGPGKPMKEIYKGKVVCDKTNEDLPYEGLENGKPVRRQRQINVLCLNPKDLTGLPFVISFRKTGMQTGKKLSTHFQVCAMKGIPGAKFVFNLFSVKQTKEGYEFYKFEVEQSRMATDEEVNAAYGWYQTFNKGNAKVEDEFTEQAPF